MNEAEDLVVAQLERWGFRCEVFSKQERRSTKTPDRRVYRAQHFAFFLEVKEIVADNWAGGDRDDPRFNRLASDVHEAVKQFDAVNPDREHMNILAFVNNDSMCGALDLHGVLTGKTVADAGEGLPIYNRQARGRINEEKLRIDGYFWFDGEVPRKMLTTGSDRRHLARLHEYFDSHFAEHAG